MIALNPLVQSWEPIDDDAAAAAGLWAPDPPPNAAPPPRCERVTYRITDALPLLGGRWTGSTTYVARFEYGWDRLCTHVRADWGVSSSGVWDVQQKQGDGDADADAGLVLRETVSVTCPFFLKPFVEETMRKAHKELGEAFVERLRREEDLKVARREREEKTAESA